MTNSFIIDGFANPDVHMRAKHEEGVFALTLFDHGTVLFAYNPDHRTWDGQLTAQQWYDIYGAGAEQQIADDFYDNFEPDEDAHGNDLLNRIDNAIRECFDCQIDTVFGERVIPSPGRQPTRFAQGTEVTLTSGLPFVNLLAADYGDLRKSAMTVIGNLIYDIHPEKQEVHVFHNPPRDTMDGLDGDAWQIAAEPGLSAMLSEEFATGFAPGGDEELMDALLNDYRVVCAAVWYEPAD